MKNKLSTDKLADRVKRILKMHPDAQDSDRQLVADIWLEDVMAITSAPMSVDEFLVKFRHGKITHPESIRRRRQEVQKAHPELQGTKKKEKAQNEVEMKEDLGYPKQTPAAAIKALSKFKSVAKQSGLFD